MTRLYQRVRLWVRARRAYRKSFVKEFGELELTLLRHIVPHRVSVDVGANKGLFVYFLRKYSKAVIAIEANQFLFDGLSRTQYPGVTYICAAAAAAQGTSIFLVPKSHGQLNRNVGSLKANPKFAESEKIAVPTVRIDDVARGLDVGFIKVDTEGTELDVILGALEVIRASRPVLFIEILDKLSADAVKLFALILQMNYVAAEYRNRKLVICGSLDAIKNRNVIFLPVS